MDNIIDAIRQPLLDVATEIYGSIVYLDAGAAEVAQLSFGPAFLFGLGAVNVCDLERCHPDDALLPCLAAAGQQPMSLVVVTTQLLTDTHQAVVHLLMVHQQVQRLQLFCSVSELAHAQLDPCLSPLGVEAYSEYILALRQDVATARAAAGLSVPREDQLQLSVKHLPLHAVALDSHTFVLPAAGSVASRAVAANRAAGFAGMDGRSDTEVESDGLGISTGLSLLPHCLADLSRVLGGRLEPFAIGPVSTAIAKELYALPQQGQRGPAGGDPFAAEEPVAAGSGGTSGSIGLVLIDRSLDLATPCMHSDHVLDVVFASLPRAEPAAAPVLAAGGGANAGYRLWPKRGKDALLLLRKWLKEALRAERVSPTTRSRLSSVVLASELVSLAQCLVAQPGPWAFWERLTGVEHQLLLALPPGSDGEHMLKPMVMEAVNNAHQAKGRLLVDYVLQLLVVVYSLSGDRLPPAPPLYSADEVDIREALVDVLMAHASAAQQQQQQQRQDWSHTLCMECLPQVQHLLQQAVASGRLSADAAGVRQEVVGQLVEVFQRLRWLAACRGRLRDVRRLMQVEVDTGAASCCTPLVRQVLTKILLQADNRDLQQPENASLVAGLLNRGLGRLGVFGGKGGMSRPRISDYQVVLLFVV
eukprot:gene9236-9401_t